MLAGHDCFVFAARISEASVNFLAAGVEMMFDAAFETVVFLPVPSGIVEAERVLSCCRQMALEAAEALFWQ